MQVSTFYRHLPPFSRFLLQQQSESLAQEILSFSREADLPVLQRLAHLSEKQLYQITKGIMTEMLQYLSQNKAKEQIENALGKWRQDQLGIIGQFDLTAEDITLVYYVQGRAFRKFIPLYTQDVTVIMELLEELNSFLFSSITAATNAYIVLLKERIDRREKELLEAQRIAHIGSFDLDVSTGDAQCSPEVYRIFEIENGIDFHTLLEFIHPDDVGRVKKTMEEALSKGAYELDFRFHKNRTLKYIWSKGIAVPGDGQPARIIGTIQDITWQKKTEHELVEKTVALQRSNESLLQFAYIASHDLKEPVRKIATLANRALSGEESLSENLRISLEKVYTSALLTRRMIDDIQTYSALIVWQEKETCILEDLVKEATGLLKQSIEENNAAIEVCCPSEVHVIAPQFRQLFQNLISNALKFSRPGVPAKVSITCQWLTKDDVEDQQLVASEKYLRVSVSDNGIGFEKEFAEKIFDLFHRLHSKTTYEGSGLGLATVKRIIDNHGGLIFVRSQPGVGTTFTFIIPQ